MRTLHYYEIFSALSETFVYDYITELERQGIDNHVVTHRRENEQERPFPRVHAITQPNRWHPRRLWHRALIPLGFRKEGTSDWPQVRDRNALAEDDTTSMDVLLHALDQVEPYDYAVLLQPTSPLRTADDIDATIARCHKTEAPACVTVTEDCPKPLLEVGDQPILETILEGFIAHGFHRFYLSVNYKAGMIEDHFGDGSDWGVDITYVHE